MRRPLGRARNCHTNICRCMVSLRKLIANVMKFRYLSDKTVTNQDRPSSLLTLIEIAFSRKKNIFPINIDIGHDI